MKIQDYGLISKEWVEKEFLYYSENRNKYDLKTQPQYWHYWDNKIQVIGEINKQLISPVPLCEKILNEGVDIGFVCIKDSIFNESAAKIFKDKFINSDINID